MNFNFYILLVCNSTIMLEKLPDTLLVHIITNFLNANQYTLLVDLYRKKDFIIKLQYYSIFVFNYTKSILYSKILRLNKQFIKYNNIKFDTLTNILDFILVNGKFITKMDLSKTQINDNILMEILINSPNIETLVLNNCYKISNLSLEFMIQFNLKIKYLNLNSIGKFTREPIIKLLSQCKNLKIITLTIDHEFNYFLSDFKLKYPDIKIEITYFYPSYKGDIKITKQ